LEDAWAVLSDIPRMVTLDPMLDATLRPVADDDDDPDRAGRFSPLSWRLPPALGEMAHEHSIAGQTRDAGRGSRSYGKGRL
jgi:hypothetical protein